MRKINNKIITTLQQPPHNLLLPPKQQQLSPSLQINTLSRRLNLSLKATTPQQIQSNTHHKNDEMAWRGVERCGVALRVVWRSDEVASCGTEVA